MTPIALLSRDSGVNTCDRTGRSRNARAISPRSFGSEARRSSKAICLLSSRERTAGSVGSSGRSGNDARILTTLGPALDTIAETASQMFDAANVNLRRLEGDILRVVGSTPI